MKKHAWMILTTCLFFSASAWSQPAGGAWGGGYGPGMMGGYGPGMMGGYGPGMMGGYGPGMMWGYGPGMMGGYGPGYWGPGVADLTNEQRTKIADIQKEFRTKQWALMEKMQDSAPAHSFYRGGKFDEQAARKAYDTVAGIQKQMFENSLDTQKRIDNILTPQQREQLQRAWGGR